MSLLLSGFVKGALGIVASTAVIGPVAYSIAKSGSNSKELKLSKQADFDNCLVVIEGNSENDGGDSDGGSDRRLLACQNPSNTKTQTDFFLWVKGSSELPKEVSLVKVDSEQVPIKLSLTFLKPYDSSSSQETINLTNPNWNFLNGVNLKEKCKVEFSEEVKKISCTGIKEEQIIHYSLKELQGQTLRLFN